jgi:hypothetical protein
MALSTQEVHRLARAFHYGKDQTHTPQVRAMIAEAVRRINTGFDEIPVRVEFVDWDPYRSMLEMRDQVASTGILYIWKGASDVPMWDPLTNWKARAVHDWQHIIDQFDFTMDGEYEGFRSAARRAPQLAPLYLSEIALQAAVANTAGQFAADQKIVLLEPEEHRWATGLRGAAAAPSPEDVQMVSTMLAVMPPETVAAILGALGETNALVLIDAARAYDAMLEGQGE